MDPIKTTRGVATLLGDPKKAILKISLPMVAGMLVQNAYHIADRIWVGMLGAEALAAVGLFFPAFLVLMGLSAGIGVGGSSAISRRIGEKNYAAAEQTAAHTLVFGFLAAFAVSLPVLPFMGFIFIAMSKDFVVGALAAEYGTIFTAGSPLFFFTFMASAILRGEGDAAKATIAMAAGAVLNILLDPVFIFVFKLGVAGAAWASLVSMGISALVFVFWMAPPRHMFLNLTLRRFRFRGEMIKDIMRVGIPFSMMQLAMAASMFIVNWIIRDIGGMDGIAVFTAGWSLVMVGVIPLHGMAAGVTAVTAAAFGARAADKLQTAYYYAIKIGVILEVIVAAGIFVFADTISLLFTISEKARHLAPAIADFMRIMSTFFVIIPFGMLTGAMFQGIGKGFRSLLMTVLRTIVFQASFAFLIGRFTSLGLSGVWWGLVAGNVLAIAIIFNWGRLTVRSALPADA